jgi:hypothetical protein
LAEKIDRILKKKKGCVLRGGSQYGGRSRVELIGGEMKTLGDKCDVDLASARLGQIPALFVMMCNPPSIARQRRGSGTPAGQSAATTEWASHRL